MYHIEFYGVPYNRKMTNRRAFLAMVAPAMACRRRLAEGYPGYAFVANEGGRSVAVVDLNTFSVSKEIGIDGYPTAVLSHWRRPAVYVLTPESGVAHEIDPVSLTVRRKTRVAASAISLRLSPDGESLWVLSREGRTLTQLGVDSFQPGGRIRLPGAPGDFDLTGERAAISFPESGTFAIAGLRSARVERVFSAGPNVQTIRFHDKGRQIWCGNRGDRTVTRFDTEKSRVVAHLPIAVEPENFCFKPDGGELYVTGAGMDAVVVIQPYQTEVYETRLVGRSPGAMALSSAPDYLFVANAGAGNVTVMDIVTGKVFAVVTVGAVPRLIAVTPDNQYAMTLNSGSGDMAVIRIAAVSNRNRSRTTPIPLFTMIPVGAKPVSVAIRAM
jgi:YVTN family beta-propeller protein